MQESGQGRGRGWNVGLDSVRRAKIALRAVRSIRTDRTKPVRVGQMRASMRQLFEQDNARYAGEHGSDRPA